MPKTPSEQAWEDIRAEVMRAIECAGGSGYETRSVYAERAANMAKDAIEAAQAEARAEERARCADIILDLIEGYRGGQSPPAVLLKAERRILEEGCSEPEPGPAGEEGRCP